MSSEFLQVRNIRLVNYIGDLPEIGDPKSREAFQSLMKAFENMEYDRALPLLKKVKDPDKVPANKIALTILEANVTAAADDNEGACKLYEKALRAARKASDHEGEAAALFNLGVLQRVFGDIKKSDSYFTAGLDAAVAFGNARAQADFHDSLAENCLGTSRDADAYNHFSSAFEIERGMGDIIGMAYHLSSIGFIFHSGGELDKALEKYREALSLYEDVDDVWGEANTLERLAAIYADLEDEESAELTAARALELFRELADKRGEASALLTTGIARAIGDKFEEAVEHIEQALAIFSNIGDRLSMYNCFYELADVYFGTKDYIASEKFFNKALKGYGELGLLQNMADAWYGLARTSFERKDFAGAAASFDRSAALYEQVNDPVGRGNVLQFLANAYFKMGDSAAAVANLETARAAFEAAGDFEGVRMAEHNMKWILGNAQEQPED